MRSTTDVSRAAAEKTRVSDNMTTAVQPPTPHQQGTKPHTNIVPTSTHPHRELYTLAWTRQASELARFRVVAVDDGHRVVPRPARDPDRAVTAFAFQNALDGDNASVEVDRKSADTAMVRYLRTIVMLRPQVTPSLMLMHCWRNSKQRPVQQGTPFHKNKRHVQYKPFGRTPLYKIRCFCGHGSWVCPVSLC